MKVLMSLNVFWSAFCQRLITDAPYDDYTVESLIDACIQKKPIPDGLRAAVQIRFDLWNRGLIKLTDEDRERLQKLCL